MLNNTECIEPISSNIFTRRTSAGTFTIINRHLVRDLLRLGLWSKDLKDRIIAHDGSVQNIKEAPDQLKRLYKTCWELPQRALIDMAADRGIYVCQSQSLNLFVRRPGFDVLSSMYFHAWKRGLKTLSYYCRIKPATQALQFSISPDLVSKGQDTVEDFTSGSAEGADCLTCSS